jgi:pyrrolidone-carboxylate peptidase
MDIQILGEDSLKIKSKKATLAIDPKTSIQKFDADAILLTGKVGDTSRVTEHRVVINGVGEYEVAGLKIVGIKSEEELVFTLVSDNVRMLVAKASSLKKISTEKIGDCQIVAINADDDVSESTITAMEPNVVVLYGLKAKETAKALGKEDISVSSKASFAEDKLPEETQVLVLG